jgi:hypothetical protein
LVKLRPSFAAPGLAISDKILEEHPVMSADAMEWKLSSFQEANKELARNAQIVRCRLGSKCFVLVYEKQGFLP